MRGAFLLGLVLAAALPVPAWARNLAVVGTDEEGRDRGPSREEISEVAIYFLDLHVADDPADRVDHTLRIALDPASGEGRWTAALSAGEERIGLEGIDLRFDGLRAKRIEVAITRLLLAAGYRRGGRLTIEAHPDDATLTVGTGLMMLPGQAGTLTLEPGTYTVAGRADGYEPASVEIVVPVGANALVVLNLTPADDSFVGSVPFMIGATTLGVLVTVVISGLVFGALTSGDGPSTVPTTFCQSTSPEGCAGR